MLFGRLKLKTDFEYVHLLAFFITVFQSYCFIENLPSPNANSHYEMFNPMIIFQKVVKPKPMCVSGNGFQFHTPGTKENILSEEKMF